MLKDVYQKYYFEQNYNCAETLLRAANDYYDLKLHDRDMIMVGAYGAGIQCGNTCGAVLAAASVLSMKYVEAKAHESEDIRPVVMKLMRKFNAKYGSTLCKDIKPQRILELFRVRSDYRPRLAIPCQRTVTGKSGPTASGDAGNGH